MMRALLSQPSSLAARLTRLNLLVTATALLLACAAFVAFDLLTFRQSIVRNLSIQAQVLGSNSVAALVFNDRDSAEKTLAALRAAPDVLSACLYSADGRPFVEYHRGGSGGVPPLARLGPGEQENHRFAHGDVMLLDRIVFQSEPTGYIYLESSLDALWARVRLYLFISVGVLLGALVAALAVSFKFRRAILQPIHALAEVARLVAYERNYAVRAAGEGAPLELGHLVAAFNGMLVQIELRDRELRQARDELEQRVELRTAELAAANKELESFSYSVSHDLRAPLRSIDGFSLALLQDYGDSLGAEARDYFERIRVATRRMGILIDDLLNLARVSRRELRRERVNLTDMARAVEADLRKSESRCSVEFRIQDGVEAEGDAHLLRVVLDNLLSNAWKYTSKHPTARIEFGQTSSNGHSVFFVKDDGAGFDPVYAGKLFGAFQRLHGSSEFPGTGVGLATVQRILHRHGGRIWAESAVEKGATFYFTVQGEAQWTTR